MMAFDQGNRPHYGRWPDAIFRRRPAAVGNLAYGRAVTSSSGGRWTSVGDRGLISRRWLLRV
ncbi:hypothetical protein ACNKHP_07080 [Shigella boydii]